MKKLLIKKSKGQGDLIASLFVLLALTLFVFFFVNSIGDINTRIQLDQIARKYMLRMESAGELTADEMTDIKEECNALTSVSKATGGDLSKINVTWNNSEGKKSYGGTITLEIICPAVVTTYKNDEGTFIGTIKRDASTAINYVITKQSTAKY